MRGFLKRHTETVVVAFVVAAVTAGAPAIAAVVQNAHHAHTADVAKNAQHLGGVGPSGYLKTNSSVDAATLNGKSAADFLPTTGIAADSSKLGGQPASAYALKTDVPGSIWADIKPGTSAAVVAGSGVTGVTRKSTGVYCLTVSGTPPAGAVGLATVDFSQSTTPGTIFVEVDSKPTATGTGNPSCTAGQFAVRTFVSQSPSGLPGANNPAAPDDGVGFVFSIT